MIWQYLNNISTDYVFGGSRYEPYNTDCSGIVCAGFWQKLGIEPNLLGAWTGAQWVSPILETIWEGTTSNLPWNLMQEDDLIFTSTESPLFDSEWGSHVGLYTGDSNMPFLSHFKDGGPYITKVNSVYGGMECYYGVKRMKGLDMTPDEHNLLVEVHNQLTRVDTAGHDNPYGHDFFGRIQIIENAVEKGVASWAYKNENMNGSDDTYQMLTDIRDALRLILRKLDE